MRISKDKYWVQFESFGVSRVRTGLGNLLIGNLLGTCRLGLISNNRLAKEIEEERLHFPNQDCLNQEVRITYIILDTCGESDMISI